MKPLIICLAVLVLPLVSCQKDPTQPNADPSRKLSFSVKFDPEQQRLNNIGLPANLPNGHAAQTPEFQQMSIHYIELAANAFTPLGSGAVLFKGAETTKGGENAVDFDHAILIGNGELMTEISLKNLPPGTYEWVRTSVTYQNYLINFNLKNLPIIGNLENQQGTVASFVGFNTFISSVTPNQKTLAVNDDKKQGFWAFETSFSAPLDVYNAVISGEAPAAATTVVNPLFLSSPIPAGSCVVTGKFAKPLVITGNETGDIKVTLSFSVNQSFEWEDFNQNGQLDFYADDPIKNERIVDMGLRGLEPDWE